MRSALAASLPAPTSLHGHEVRGRFWPPGRPRADEKHDHVMNLEQGNSSSYLLRRLARDHPVILARYERGASARSATASKAAWGPHEYVRRSHKGRHRSPRRPARQAPARSRRGGPQRNHEALRTLWTCLPRTLSVGQRRGRPISESHPPASDRQRHNPVKDGDLRTATSGAKPRRCGEQTVASDHIACDRACHMAADTLPKDEIEFTVQPEGRRATCTIGPSLDPWSGSAWLGLSQKVRLR
jgi:hypothetical protein